ncbi:MAG TPA: hypothetical protein PLO87_12910 [Ornithinibacter sp.]|jgi:hypothetical protein|nr:hypothetical protein [Dermatophilaceae bacterium]MBU9943643.1 hypothetical protein [Dermatophilaceae bacterium]HOB80214.1 hypothetical protein [Ornithinibacter sp.]HQA14892.1 hypothetical protein [Ornithinibacter sp.]HQD69483.1 hypothetical protein [Ornithinibacter sp.]
MSAPTEELGRVLRASAADTLERAHLAGPDAATLWGRGRRSAMVSRLAAAGLTGLALLLVAAVALVMRTPVLAPPADGEGPPYPQFVSALAPGSFRGGPSPVFALVAAVGDAPVETYVVTRAGLLDAVHGTSPAARSGVLAPDGHHLLTSEGIVDLRDGSLVQPMRGEPDPGGPVLSDGRWSPDSQLVLLDTADGPTVLDAFANPLWVTATDDTAVLPAGWLDAATALGVRVSDVDGIRTLHLVTRSPGDAAWTDLRPIDGGAVEGLGSPSAAHASPDGSSVLVIFPAVTGSDAVAGVLVDTRTGERVAFAGGDIDAPGDWGACDPVWQGNVPLTASGGLYRAADGAAVMEFSDRLDFGCVTLAGNELTGAPEARSAGLVREQVWGVALPIGVGLVVIALVWSAVTLRRSRRRGERFLPWILTYPF